VAILFSDFVFELSVAIRADQITLRDFTKDGVPGPESGLTDVEYLRGRIPMVIVERGSALYVTAYFTTIFELKISDPLLYFLLFATIVGNVHPTTKWGVVAARHTKAPVVGYKPGSRCPVAVGLGAEPLPLVRSVHTKKLRRYTATARCGPNYRPER